MDGTCSSLSFLLDQIKKSQPPPEGTEIVIVTDKSLNIDQQTAVSTILNFCGKTLSLSVDTFVRSMYVLGC